MRRIINTLFAPLAGAIVGNQMVDNVIDFSAYKAKREAAKAMKALIDQMTDDLVWVESAAEPIRLPPIDFAEVGAIAPYKIEIREPAATAGLLPPCDV